MALTISLMNQKGGVAKTTMSLTIARELSKKYKVLLIDHDTQQTLTDNLKLNEYFDNIKHFFDENGLHLIYNKVPISEINITQKFKIDSKDRVKINQLCFIPSDGNIIAESAETVVGAKDLALVKFIKNSKINERFDYIVIDSLPSSGTLFKNILCATNILIIPIETKTNSMNGSLKFLQTVDEIASDYDIDLKSIYAIPTKYNKAFL